MMEDFGGENLEKECGKNGKGSGIENDRKNRRIEWEKQLDNGVIDGPSKQSKLSALGVFCFTTITTSIAPLALVYYLL